MKDYTYYLWIAGALLSGFFSACCYIKASMYARPKPGERDPSTVWIIASICWALAMIVCFVCMGVTTSSDPDPIMEVGLWTLTS